MPEPAPLVVSPYTLLFDLAGGPGKVAFNARTGAIVALNERVWRCLDLRRPDWLLPAEKRRFVELGLVGCDPPAELDWLRRRYAQLTAPASQTRFIVHTTNACNLACGYCYERHQDLDKRRMSLDTAEVVARFIRRQMEAPERRRAVLKFYGGEPLLARDALRHVARAAHEGCAAIGKELFVWVKTNGTLIDAGTFAPPCPKPTVVEITLDGPRARHDRTRTNARRAPTWERIVRSLHLLARQEIPVILRVNAHGAADLEQALLDLERAGVRELPQVGFYECQVDEHFYEHTQGRDCDGLMHKLQTVAQVEEMRAFIRASAWVSRWQEFPVFSTTYGVCDFGRPGGGFIIDARADVYLCTFQAGNPDFRVAQVEADGSAVFGDNYREIMARSPFDDERCAACAKLPLCWGGCFAKARVQTGSFQGRFCGNTETMLPHLMRAALRERRP